MQRHRNLSKTKQQFKAMARELNKTDRSHMPDGEFQGTIIIIFTGLDKRMEDFREALTTEIKKLKKHQ